MILIYLTPRVCDHGWGLLTPMLDRKIQYPSPPHLFVNLLYVNLSSVKVLIAESDMEICKRQIKVWAKGLST